MKKFISEIKDRREDAGFSATLRRALTEQLQETAWPLIAARCSRFYDVNVRRIWCTVAGATAWVVKEDLLSEERYYTLGKTLRDLDRQELRGREKSKSKNKDEDLKSPMAMRLRRLLECASSSELCQWVPSVVRLAVSKGAKVNCLQLYWDLCDFDDSEKREKVRVQWTHDFYWTEESVEKSGEGTLSLDQKGEVVS